MKIEKKASIGQWNGVPEDCDGWECVSFGKKLTHWATKYGERIALTDGIKAISYEQLNCDSVFLGNFFEDKGIKKNDLVLLQLSNSIIYVQVLFGLFKLGAVPILILPAHREYEIEGIMQNAHPSAYISMNNRPGVDYEKMAKKIALNHSMESMLFFEEEIRAIMNNNEANLKENQQYEAVSYDDIALMLLSGGTTGIPKLIPRTHADYIYNSITVGKKLAFDEHIVYLAVLPASHNFALAAPGILGTFAYGGKVVMSEYASPVDIFDLIEEMKVNVVSLVPTLVSMCLEYRKMDGSHDLTSLELLLVGGAMFTESEAARIRLELGCKLVQVYGTAEGLICTTSLNDSENILVSCQGKPCSPHDLIKIVDNEDRLVSIGESGEVLTKGPYTISGYYNNQKANSESFTMDGFYRTGDRALLTPEGNIKVLGRITEQINRAGEKIMPAILEELLKDFEKISDSCIIGIPDALLGNKICCFVTAAQKDITLEQIKHFLAQRGIAEYRMPDIVKRVECWPLTAVGKIDKKKLLEIALETEG